MKAVIMAGGLGTRLRPVSGEVPKPMVPMLGRPMMEHIVSLLRSCGFGSICCALGYKAGDIMAYFGDGSRFGVSMEYRVEKEALGTAGAVLNCRDFWQGDDFLVISGDAACDFDLAKLMAEHRNRSACATIALCRHPEPLSYGLAVTDSDGLIRCFVEKPDWSRVVTDTVNTGIYILSPAAMEYVPAGQPFDFGRQLFPLLIEQGEKVLGLPMDGYWCDVGDPLSYYRCCADGLTGKLRLSLPESFAASRPLQSDSRPDAGSASLECPCRSRAEVMDALKELMLPEGALFSDGLRLSYPRVYLHIAPLASRSALRVSVTADDAQFARELCLSAKRIIDSLESR